MRKLALICGSVIYIAGLHFANGTAQSVGLILIGAALAAALFFEFA